MNEWMEMGTSGPYHFWFRSPYEMETGYVYQTTLTGIAPDGEAGYYNLEALMDSKDVTYIEPAKGSML